MRLLRPVTLSAIAFLVAAPALAQGAADVPRNETLIVENPEGTIKNAGWFNVWAANAGGQSTGLQQLAIDTFWYIDPDAVWTAYGTIRSPPSRRSTMRTSPR